MRASVFGAGLGVAASACFVVAYLNRNPEVESAYFSREIGADSTPYAPLEQSLFNPFDPWNGYLWLGAGIALVLVALALLMVRRFPTS